MRNLLFIDTGAFLARYLTGDIYHQEARDLWKRVQKESLACVTTNFVVLELSNLLLRRVSRAGALKGIREIYQSQLIKIDSVDTELELAALGWLEKFADQDFSLTDAVSFAFMEREKMRRAFTFDHHFAIAGYEIFS